MHDSFPEFLARENIRRFEEQIRASADNKQKAIVQHLLDIERQHLQEILRIRTA